ncbi:MAG: alpha/beta fold hydrolase [Actinomycetota bacterium]|nr:alpha/beta fold hydrolase [Actinomycetota bacterium]
MSAPSVPALAAVSRVNFAFSPDGRQATCIRVSEGELTLEMWSFAGGRTQPRRVDGDLPLDQGAQTLPLDDGRILLFPNSAEVHELMLLDPRRGSGAVLGLGKVRSLGGYLLPSPNRAQLGFVVSRDDVDRSTIWRVTDSPSGMQPLLELPGVLSGGLWLDHGATRLAANLAQDGHPPNGVLLDLDGEGSWTRFFSVSDASSDRVVAYGPRSRLLVVSTNATGQDGLGWVILGAGEPVRFPSATNQPGRRLQGLTLDGGGRRLLVHEQYGATSRLAVYTPADDHVEPVNIPMGVAGPEACWSGGVVRLPFCAPTHPPTVLSLSPGRGHGWWLADTGEACERVWADAQLVALEGPAGAVEAVVYGGSDWRSSEHLVLALHGGPLSNWRLDFDPLFQAFAAAGVAVVAPNQRGSTGYGREHMRAVLGAWGGPDLDDVVHLGHDLVEFRARRGLRSPVILGASYGAFLALLAAARAPQLWSACVAVAPFLSGPQLYDNSPPWVAQRLEVLGALTPVTDAIGPRDVQRLCSAIAAPLLVLHGAEDEVIPVEQSRTLRRQLLNAGREEGVDFVYREVHGDHEEVIRADRRAHRELLVDFCLATSLSTPNESKGGEAHVRA